MALKMLAVEASRTAVVPNGPIFRHAAHHVKEVFLALLPKPLTLDGSTKIQVTCGPRDGEPPYQQLLRSTNYFLEDFDFAQYYRLGDAGRDEFLLQKLEKAFVDILFRHGERLYELDFITRAAEQARAHDYSLVVHSGKLSKLSLDRLLMARVCRHLNRVDGEAWSCEIVAKRQRTLVREWIGDRPDYLDRTDLYHSSRWTNRCFIIQDKFENIEYQIDIDELERRQVR